MFFLFYIAGNSLFAQVSAVQLYEQGNIAIDRGLFFEAIQFNQQALRINSNYAEAYGSLSEAYFYMNEYDEALIHIDEALRLDPRNLGFQNFRGRIYLALGNTSRAQEVFSGILGQNPFNQNALLGQAELLLSTGNLTGPNRVFSIAYQSPRGIDGPFFLLLSCIKTKGILGKRNVIYKEP